MCFGYSELSRVLINAGLGRMSALGANRTRRDGGNDVNDPKRTWSQIDREDVSPMQNFGQYVNMLCSVAPTVGMPARGSDVCCLPILFA